MCRWTRRCSGHLATSVAEPVTPAAQRDEAGHASLGADGGGAQPLRLRQRVGALELRGSGRQVQIPGSRTPLSSPKCRAASEEAIQEESIGSCCSPGQTLLRISRPLRSSSAALGKEW